MNEPTESIKQHELTAAEAARRETAWSPAERWLVLQRTIAWAAAQDTVRRNTPHACLEHQRRLLKLKR